MESSKSGRSYHQQHNSRSSRSRYILAGTGSNSCSQLGIGIGLSARDGAARGGSVNGSGCGDGDGEDQRRTGTSFDEPEDAATYTSCRMFDFGLDFGLDHDRADGRRFSFGTVEDDGDLDHDYHETNEDGNGTRVTGDSLTKNSRSMSKFERQYGNAVGSSGSYNQDRVADRRQGHSSQPVERKSPSRPMSSGSTSKVHPNKKDPVDFGELDQKGQILDLSSGAGHTLLLFNPANSGSRPTTGNEKAQKNGRDSSWRGKNQLYVCGSNQQGQLSGHDFNHTRRTDAHDAATPSSVLVSYSSQSLTNPAPTSTDSSRLKSSKQSPCRRLLSGFTPLPIESLVELAGLPRYLSSPSSSPSLAFEDGDGEAGNKIEIEYEVKAVAASWTTSFVVLSRTFIKCHTEGARPYFGGSDVSEQREAENREDQHPRLGDIILSFGSNDFGELGIGTTSAFAIGSEHQALGKVHTVSLPPTDSNQNGDWIVFKLVASQRHVVALLESLADKPNETQMTGEKKAKEERQTVVVGWGASRHGQLSPSSYFDRLAAVQAQCQRSIVAPGFSSSPIPNESTKANDAGCESSIEQKLDADKEVPRREKQGHQRPLSKAKAKKAYYQPIIPIPTTLDFTSIFSSTSPSSSSDTHSAANHTTTTKQEKIIDLALGASHTVFVTSHGRVIALGSNVNSQIPDALFGMTNLSLPVASSEGKDDLSFTKRRKVITKIAATWNGTFILRENLDQHDDNDNNNNDIDFIELLSMGRNTHGQLGRLDDGEEEVGRVQVPWGCLGVSPKKKKKDREGRWKVKKLVAGSEHVLLLLEKTVLERSSPSPPSPSSSSSPSESESESESGAGKDVSPDDDEDQFRGETKLFTWGWNEHGNLGLGQGDLQDRETPVEVEVDVREHEVDREDADTSKNKRRGQVVDCWAGCGTSWVVVEDVSR